MDHRIANDMISSGMIPSGEKKKEDLSRTQYGSAPSPSALADVYKKMYGVDEEIDPMDLGKSKRTLQQKQQARANQQIRRGNLPTGAPPGAENVEQGKAGAKDMGSNSQTISKPKKKDTQSKGFGESSVDLLASYNAVYEHHKKDADGNTIPHEDEELEEKVIKIKKDLGETTDLFDIISTYFIEEGYDKKDVYAAMSSVDLSEEVQDLHEILPAVMAGVAKVGGILAKGGAMASKALAGAGKVGAAAGKVGAAAGKVGSGAAKVTKSGGAIVQGGGPTSLMGKAKKFVKDNPLTSYSIARDMTSGGGGNQQPMMSKRTSTVSASADLFDIVKGQLLDEGLSEEEIKDIMLTLTPDEIMEELSDNIKRIDAANKAKFEGSASEKVKAAAKRQYKAGSPGAEPYTTADKKTIIGANKKPVERTGGRTDGTAGSYVEKPKM